MADQLTQEQFVNQVLQDWAFEVDRVLRKRLKERVGYVPSETLRNLRAEVLQAKAGQDAARYLLQFQDSGRIIEMKNISRRKRPILPNNNFILEWVKKQGLSSFRRVPGYQSKGRMQLSEEQQMSRIASAIIANKGRNIRARSRGSRRLRKWFNATFYGMIEQLIRDLLDKQAGRILQQTKDDLTDAFRHQ